MNDIAKRPEIPKAMQGTGIRRFDFFQAVKLLEAMNPEGAQVGETASPEMELLRFKPKVGFAFPAGDTDRLDKGESPDDPNRFWVHFMGLASHFGPLPDSFTEWVMHETSDKNFAMRDFLDIFNHRLISLMVRIRRKHRLGLEAKHPEETGFAGYLFSLLGLRGDRLRGRQSVRDRVFLDFTGLLLRRSRSMPGLELMLRDFFRVPVRGDQFVGRWEPIDDDVRSAIGHTGRNRTLGAGCLLGKHAWNQQSAIVLHIGPLEYPQFLKFLPIGTRFSELRALTRFYLGSVNADCRLRLTLKTETLPGARLSAEEGKGALLGWTSWLRADAVATYPSIRI